MTLACFNVATLTGTRDAFSFIVAPSRFVVAPFCGMVAASSDNVAAAIVTHDAFCASVGAFTVVGAAIHLTGHTWPDCRGGVAR
jgi:hypothetical protein